MSVTIAETDLPTELNPQQAVEAAYPDTLAEAATDLARGLPVLVECDKDLVPYVFMSVRQRLRQNELKCTYLDGRASQQEQQQQPGGMMMDFTGMLLAQLRDAVRGAVERRVVVMPHLDLLTTSQGGLTSEAREVISLLYENPELVWLGFKDPSFSLPKVISNLFPRHTQILGIPRDRLPHLVTQSEARKFGRDFNPWALYKYTSGTNAARLRKLLSTLEGEDYPENPEHAYAHIRQATLKGELQIPSIDLENDIGGYAGVKKRIQSEILDVLTLKDATSDGNEIKRMEGLIPRGMIFWGPPGTGKTLFAKAMATAIGAAIQIVSGPELKSRFVGDSEENLRQVFHQARQSAPSIIVFDELDSFASSRGTYTGSGVEHSMVNQLLTEMDGFRSEELVFVVGTTNFVESLDPALLRPGRFEFHLQIPYPEAADRREIITIYNQKMDLQMSEEAIEYTVKRTGEPVEGGAMGSWFSGDHINALCRSIARRRLRENKTSPTELKDVEQTLLERAERPKFTPKEEQVVATHEAGHAVVALHSEHAPTIERISIQGDITGALGYVKHETRKHKYVLTEKQLLDEMAVLMGGREAEKLLLDDLSIGSAGDLEHATDIARALVEEFGMGGEGIGTGRFLTRQPARDKQEISPTQLNAIDARVKELLGEAETRAARIVSDHRSEVEALRDLLVEHKVVDAKTLSARIKS